MHTITTIIALIIVLGVVIFVHELGHFLAARWAGVRVDTFSIGFGPAIVKWHDKHGTVWKIACLPLGGYVSIYGQEDMFNRKKYKDLPDDKKVGHYLSAPAWKQCIIIGAGVFMNFVLVWAIYSFIFMVKSQPIQLPVVGQVKQESVAFNAHVEYGDVIVKIDGKDITNWGELIIAKERAGAHNIDADVVIARNGELINVKLSPAKEWGIGADRSKVGFKKTGFFGSLYAGARQTYYLSKNVLIALKNTIIGAEGYSVKDLGSFISIAKISGQALATGVFALLQIIALISVNLGVINLLPLPVLDGGYLLILMVEGITRKKLGGKGMEIVILCGWIFLGFVFVLTMWNDLRQVFGL